VQGFVKFAFVVVGTLCVADDAEPRIRLGDKASRTYLAVKAALLGRRSDEGDGG
jgi:hypothetical protein